MKPITADTAEGRILLALRAGAVDSEAIYERFPSFSVYVKPLARAGMVTKSGDEWQITPAGRAACPFRNPLLASVPASTSEEKIMNSCAGLTYKDIVAAITAAGPDGITRKQLGEQFGAGTRTEFTRVDAHIFYALKQEPAVIARLKHGHYVAAQWANGAAAPAVPAVDEAEVAKIAADYANTSIDLAAAQEIDLTATPLEEGFVDALRESAGRNGVTPTSYSSNLPSHLVLAEDIELDDPEQVEFAIFSSGGLDMYTDQGNVTLSRDVLRKLRAFLGLFAEEVA